MSVDDERPMFFASSDDEDMVHEAQAPDKALVASGVPEEPGTGAASPALRPRSPTQKPLFFADSDDEEPTSYRPQPAVQPIFAGDDADIELSDVEMPEFVEVPRASSVSSTSSGLCDSPTSLSFPLPARSHVDEPPPKKRKISPELVPPTNQDSMYLGYFLVDNAWSTVKGSGYIKHGDEIRIERDDPDVPPPPPSKKPAKKEKGKDGKKQLTIANMFKPAPAKPDKKKKDSVVRIINSRGFGARF